MIRKKYHSVIYVPIKGIKGAKIPVILLPDGSRFHEALHWTLERYKRHLSAATLTKQNEALGRFIDLFYFLDGTLTPASGSLTSLLHNFRNYRLNGFVDLGWRPISPSSVDSEIEYISAFYDHCADSFGYEPINAPSATEMRSLSYSEKMRQARQANYKGGGLLGYLWKRTAAAKQTKIRPLKRARGAPTDGLSYKTFPPEKVSELIESCHAIRDVLAFLLLFYGGIRSSELCHLFVQDIEPFPDSTGQAIVMIAHPVYGWVNYHRRVDGRYVNNVQRQVYLQEEYGLTPRNLLPVRDPMHAGWKGMTYEERGYRSFVNWSRPDMGIMFYNLHKKYMSTRARMPSPHPYYFSNVDPSRSGANYGHPLKLKGLRDRFYDACLRIGLVPGRDGGVNPHGARHFYGYFLSNVLRLPKEMAQRFFRHATAESTSIYYNLTASTARNELLAAFHAAKLAGKNPLLQPITIKAEKP